MPITADAFESLLNWLDPDDREVAGQQYEIIHSVLVRVFVSKGFADAEHLADETFDRAMKRLPDIKDTYEGDPTRYLHGIARNIIRERSRPREISTDEFPVCLRELKLPTELHTCLLHCLSLLSDERRELILDYYIYSGREKALQHRIMSDELLISENALRVRVCHIRARLEKCVKECIKGAAGNEK